MNAKSNAREGDGVATMGDYGPRDVDYNGCHSQAIRALRYLARHGQCPDAGEQFPNTACCQQIADELERSFKAIAAMQAQQGAEPVAFRFLRQLSREQFAWTRWLGMDELHHYGPNGDFVDGPAPDWKIEYAYAPATGVPR